MPQVNADYFSHSWDEAGHEEEAPVAPACRDAVPLEPVLSKSQGYAERHDKVTTVPKHGHKPCLPEPANSLQPLLGLKLKLPKGAEH